MSFFVCFNNNNKIDEVRGAVPCFEHNTPRGARSSLNSRGELERDMAWCWLCKHIFIWIQYCSEYSHRWNIRKAACEPSTKLSLFVGVLSHSVQWLLLLDHILWMFSVESRRGLRTLYLQCLSTTITLNIMAFDVYNLRLTVTGIFVWE